MKDPQSGQYQVHNLTEDTVEERLLRDMEKSDMCTCDRCVADVRAYALNHLPPQYVVSQIGNAFVLARSLSAQANADLVAAILDGIVLVKRNPRH
ncbi:MAG: late competence development ComFB family protein [Oscillospiraceae bacterium]|jgi:competence protein ComFB|nr:late competence development ComFB family protein [Oscillospiraceae bacterium]